MITNHHNLLTVHGIMVIEKRYLQVPPQPNPTLRPWHSCKHRHRHTEKMTNEQISAQYSISAGDIHQLMHLR